MARRCDDCGNVVPAGTPRRQVRGQMLCPACSSGRPGGGRVTAAARPQTHWHVASARHRDRIDSVGLTGDENGHTWLHSSLADAHAYRDSMGHTRDAEMRPALRDVYEVDTTGMRTRKDPHVIGGGVPGNPRVASQPIGPERVKRVFTDDGSDHSAWERGERQPRTAAVPGRAECPVPGCREPMTMKLEAKDLARREDRTWVGCFGHIDAARKNLLTMTDKAAGVRMSQMHAKNASLTLTASRIPSISVVAHDSGDGQTIYHCPFCGSGQVIARSDRTTECEFCHNAFTVQVQPQYPAFPQTIDGQPVQVPGMPGSIDQAGSGLQDGTDGADAQADPDGDGLIDPDDVPPDGANASDGPPQAGDDAGDGGDDSGGGDFTGPASKTNQPPWLKGSSLRYATAAGDRLTEDQYVRHLAIRHGGVQRVAALLRGQR